MAHPRVQHQVGQEQLRRTRGDGDGFAVDLHVELTQNTKREHLVRQVQKKKAVTQLIAAPWRQGTKFSEYSILASPDPEFAPNPAFSHRKHPILPDSAPKTRWKHAASHILHTPASYAGGMNETQAGWPGTVQTLGESKMMANGRRSGLKMTILILGVLAGIGLTAGFLPANELHMDPSVDIAAAEGIEGAAEEPVALSFTASAPLPVLPEGALARIGSGSLRDFSLSADGEQALVASSIGVHLYNTGDFSQRWMQPSPEPVTQINLSPDGRLAASFSGSTITLRETDTGGVVHTIDTSGEEVFRVAFSPDGRRLAIAANNEVSFFDLASGQRRVAAAFGAKALDAAWAPDGGSLAVAARDLLLVNAETGEQRVIVPLDPQLAAWQVSWAGNGSRIAAGLLNGTALVTDVETGSTNFLPQQGTITSLALSPDGTLLAAGMHDGKIVLRDAATFETLATFNGHRGRVTGLAFTHKGASLISTGEESAWIEWDLSSGRETRINTPHASAINSLAWSPDGATIATGAIDGTIQLWDANTGAPLAQLVGHGEAVSRLVWSPDGAVLASVAAEPVVLLWDAESGAQVQRLEVQAAEPINSKAGIELVLNDPAGATGSQGNFLSAAFSPDGARLVTGGEDAQVIVWDVTTGAAEQVLEGHLLYVYDVAFLNSGSQIVSVSIDGMVIRWDADSGTPISQQQTPGVASLAVSPDEHTFALGAWEDDMLLSDPASGEILHRLTGSSDAVIRAQFNPAGSLLATGASGDFAAIVLWDVDSGQQLLQFSGHSMQVRQVAFSPDGASLASGSWDGSVLLWPVTP